MRKAILSDDLLRSTKTIFTLVVIGNHADDGEKRAKAALHRADLNSSIISESSILNFCPGKIAWGCGMSYYAQKSEILWPVGQDDLKEDRVRPGYSPNSYQWTLGAQTKYVIIRPDFIIFALSREMSELETCLRLLKARMEPEAGL